MQLVVGRIGRPHGVRGELTVEVRTDSPERRFAPGSSLLTDPESAGPLKVTGARWHSGRLLLTFAGVGDRTEAGRLRNVRLVVEIPDDETPEDPEDFYDHQLVGLGVVDDAGTDLGTVTEVLHLPSQELLAVRTPDGREVLVPFVLEIVPEVDLAAKRVRVTPPPGLFADVPED
ncbi:ribosome maturation factor RimM [Sporichthya polymorpha]|uniref:ribosome maturation factor RimM n=1 Tax=Sporichthya polymorpha TaxID=35751 RepID=UPI000375CE26|nr:ribosome maturation factor RimM [Sporichthya polymorpha]